MKNPRRILIYRLGSLGDTIVALPSFHLVRNAFPDAQITLLTNIPINIKAAPAASILDGTGLINDYVGYPVSLRNPLSLWKLRNEIASRQFDLLIYLAKPRGGALKSLRDSLFFFACGLFRQIGVPYQKADLKSQPIPGTDLYVAESHRLAGNLRQIDQPDLEADGFWSLNLSQAERDKAAEILAPLGSPARIVAVSMGTKADAKDWTEPNWSALIEALYRRYPDSALVGLGAPDETNLTDRILAHWTGAKLNLCGTTPPRLSAAILERAAVFVGHDSGPMHLASSVGTPCVAIFSAQNRPGEWFPRGQNNKVLYHKTDCFGCGLSVCVEQKKKCILSITVEEVLGAIEGILK